MTDERKQEYTLKITNANKGQLVVIIYDLAIDYIKEAIDAKKAEEISDFRESVSRSQKCVEDLIAGLDMEYEISHSLWHLYFYINKRLSEAIKNSSIEPLEEVKKILSPLRDAFDEVSKIDNSNPMIENSQTVLAGMTYGKHSLNESLQNNGENRGYFA